MASRLRTKDVEHQAIGLGLLARLTNRRNAEATVASAENIMSDSANEALRLLQNYEETAQGWFWSTDHAGKILYLSPQIAKLFPTDLVENGVGFTSLFNLSCTTEHQQRSLPFLFARKLKFEQFQLAAAIEAEPLWWSISGTPQFDAAGEFIGFLGFGIDVTEQREADEISTQLTKYDPLTGLLNRFRMSQLLENTLAAFNSQNRSCAIMLLDLDRFKSVNDTLGHPAGDALLKQVASRLAHVVGDKERVSRLGGDEFQVILPDVEDRGDLASLANEIISKLSEPYIIDDGRCIIGASVGIAVSPFDGESSEDLVRNADLALYSAKGSGRGRYRFYSEDLLRAAEERRVLEEDLLDALNNGQIEIHYQPVVCTATDRVSGFEALMRWKHPEKGYISPALFIPIAEETDIIRKLGGWMLRKACEDAASWPGSARVAVNVSPIQFSDPNLPRHVMSALASSGLAPARLELEITESVFLGDSKETNKMFAALKDLGVRLALDDFGTGYSSLSYLQHAPFDKIKIDQSFVRNATEKGSRNSAIIAAIVALADALEMDTTAEGVETLDQLDLIRNLRVSHIQGYVYSKAVSNDFLSQRLSEGEWVIPPSGHAKQRNKRISLFRKVGAVHENHYYPTVIRNLSTTGALIEGLIDVPVGTKFVIDFGQGQLAVAQVVRSKKNQQGIEFESCLVDDGNGGLCTPHRVPKAWLAAAGIPIDSNGIDSRRLLGHDSSKNCLPAFNTDNGAIALG
jgi:diguanylate cyclase (GGDEF)-like protein